MSERTDFSSDEALRDELSLEVINSDDPFLNHEINPDIITAVCEMSEAISNGLTFEQYQAASL